MPSSTEMMAASLSSEVGQGSLCAGPITAFSQPTDQDPTEGQLRTRPEVIDFMGHSLALDRSKGQVEE